MDNTIDFDYSISKVIENTVISLDYQGGRLNSSNMNASFAAIEKDLNTMYEKTRYLQDAIDYSKTFLELKIKDYKGYISSVVKNIEDIRDLNKNMSYMEYPVKFIANRIKLNDRDNSLKSSCDIKDDKLVIGNKTDIEIPFKSCTRKNDYIPYHENLSDISNDPYRTVYIEQKVISNGMKEHIVINFSEPVTMNYINIEPINATVENLRYVYINGFEDYITSDTGITNTKIISSIKFDLVCKSYSISTYSINKAKITDNLWNKIKEFEYNYVVNATSKVDAEEIISRISKKYNSTNTTEEIFASSIPDKTNLLDMSYYTYSFGIDKIEIKLVEQETESIFISDVINVGSLKETEFIQLTVKDYCDENCCIEYSILDGDKDVPILPLGLEHVENELIFNELPLRFNMDESTYYVIKKNGLVTEISLDDAKTQLVDKFTIDYFPAEAYKYTPLNSAIKIKATIRTFGRTAEVPYVETIKVRKYGGNLLWMEKL